MRCLFPLLAVAALASPALADGEPPQRWHITAPAGWTDATAKLADSPIVTGQRDQIESTGLHNLRFWFWTAEDMAPPVRLLQVMTGRGDTVEHGPAVLEGFSVGMKSSASKMEDSHATDARDPYGMTIVTSGTTSGQHMFMKSIVGLDGERHLSTATTLCFGDETSCHAALASFTFDRTGFQRIDWDKESFAGDAGSSDTHDTRVIVIGAGIAVLVLGGVYILLRTRKTNV
ncbi:MAG TPA: hypothetical protein VGM88_27070 [Kofleriaceae bacterium]|jgi:hypothetical protein